MKNSLPTDIKAECIAILKGYRRRKWSQLPEDKRRTMAVEKALETVCSGLPESISKPLSRGLMANCTDGRRNPFEQLSLDSISRSDFYRHRNKFIYLIAEYMGLVKN